MTEPEDAAAQVEQLAEEFVQRLRAGETPDPETYARAHPELASQIRRVFRAVSLMERIKPTQDEVATAARRSAPVPPDPESVGAYTLLRRIGQGGMGRVFEARGPQGQHVALKLIHTHLLREPQYVDRFLREARLGERIDHPHVVRTLATGTYDDGQGPAPYLVLEFVQGQDLKGLLEEVQVVPERLARHIGLKLAEALTAVHAVGAVHRDVKPENVVITPEEDVKLMDMGVGLLLDEERRLSHTGQFVGSLLYAAPEQFQSAALDGRTDLYALGLLLYELVAGGLPFAGVSERAAGLHADAWRNLTDVSPYFQAVLRTLLEPAREDRFASSEELAAVLREGETSAWWRAQADARPGDLLGVLPHGAAPVAFHGRAAESQALARAAADALRGHGRVVWIEGDAGIGKSRLIGEWLQAAMQSSRIDAIVVKHDVFEGDPLAEALVARLGPDDLRAKLAPLLHSSPLLVDRLAAHMLGRASDDSRALPAASLATGYRAILSSLARETPLAVVVEDLHAASEQERETFLHVARGIADDNILLIGTSRPDTASRGASVERLEHGVVVTLHGLSETEGHDLFLAALDELTVEDAARSAVAQAEGNPLFLLELARSWKGRRTDAEATTTPPVPTSIRSIFEARLQLLEASDRELLEVAACYGTEFDPVVVADAADRSELGTLRALARIERLGGILRSAGASYRFEHHLLHEALYEAIHVVLRERLHGRVARSLTTRSGDSEELDGARATLLARQWLQAAAPEDAQRYLPGAVTWLTARNAAGALLSLGELVRPHEDRLPHALRLLVFLRQAYFELQRRPTEEIIERAEEALGWSDPEGEPALHAELLVLLGKTRQYRGDFEGSLAANQESLRFSEASGNESARADTLLEIGRTLVSMGRSAEAIEQLQTSLQLAAASHDAHREAQAQATLSSALLLQHRVEEAEAAAARTAELGHLNGDQAMQAVGMTGLSRVRYRRGEYAAAARAAEDARRLYRDHGLLHNVAATDLLLGDAHLELGRFRDAKRASQQALAQGEAHGVTELRAYAQVQLVRHALARGRLAKARDHLEALEACADEVRGPLVPFRAALVLHQFSMMCGHIEVAQRACDHACELLGTPPDPQSRVRTLDARAQLHLEASEIPEACAAVDEALDVLRGSEIAARWSVLELRRAQVARMAGDEDTERDMLVMAAAHARESEVPSLLAVSLARLARHTTDDLMTARILVERDRERIHYVALMEAHFALWEATWSLPFLKEAEALLAGLRVGARPEDREHLVSNVALHRGIDAAR